MEVIASLLSVLLFFGLIGGFVFGILYSIKKSIDEGVNPTISVKEIVNGNTKYIVKIKGKGDRDGYWVEFYKENKKLGHSLIYSFDNNLINEKTKEMINKYEIEQINIQNYKNSQ